MKPHLGTALAAASLIGLGACAHGSSDTRTAKTDTSSSTSTAPTGVAAGPSDSTTPSATASSPGTASAGTSPGVSSSTAPSDNTGPQPPSTVGAGASASTESQSPAASSSGSLGQTGTTGQAGSTGSGSTSGQSGSGSASGTTGQAGTSGSASASADTGNLRQVTGQVAKVDQTANSITLDQASGGLTLTVDQNTKVQRDGKATMGLTGIREGQQVRASFDPASNRADSIEVMSRRHHRSKRGSTAPANPPNPK